MSADHRKPVVAFVLLALIATALIFVQRAEAQSARFFAAFIAGAGETHGTTRVPEDFLAGSGWWDQNSLVAHQATPARGGVPGDAARQQRQPAGRADLRDEADQRSLDRHGRPSRGKASTHPGNEADEAGRRSGGPRVPPAAEKAVLQEAHRAERSLRSSRRSAEQLPAGARRALRRSVDRVVNGTEPSVGSRDEDGLLDR